MTITASFSTPNEFYLHSSLISINNQFYSCINQQGDWKITFSLDLLIISVNSVCIEGGVIEITQSITKSPSSSPSPSPTNSISRSTSPSPSVVSHPDYRDHSISIVPTYPSLQRQRCEFDDPHVGPTYFEIGPSFYSFQSTNADSSSPYSFRIPVIRLFAILFFFLVTEIS